MADPDFYSLLYGDPTIQQKTQALSAALRQQQSAGLEGMLTGLPWLQHGGQAAMQDAQQEQQNIAEAPQRQLKMALGQQQLKGGAQDLAQKEMERAARGSPGYREGVFNLARRLNIPIQPGATADQIEPLIPNAERLFKIEEDAKLRHAFLAQKQAATEQGTPDLTPDAVEEAAKAYLTTGTLPQLGLGKNSAALRTRIINRAAEIGTGNWAGNKAGFLADSASLKKLRTQMDATQAFENTALANLDTFLNTAKTVVDSGSPLFNAPGRKFSQAVAGNPQMAAFDAARQTAVQEIAKVLSGTMGSASVSDSARHEASSLLSPDASLAQLEKAAEILKKDMENRRHSFGEQISAIESRISTPHTKDAQAPASTTQQPGATQGAAGEDIIEDKNGKRWKVNHASRKVIGEVP